MRKLGLLVLLAACGRSAPAPEPTLQVGQVLSGDDTGFARATSSRTFSFPADHAPHPEFRSEWWYLTGNLNAGPRRFGYQFTIFRQALAPGLMQARTSAWAANQVYMGHLAITDEQGRRFVAFERLSRDALGLAGAEDLFIHRLWVESWRLKWDAPLAIVAEEPGQAALALTLGAGRGPILQGEAGLSRKGPEPGNASYYYSFTRLPTEGKLTVGGQTFAVTGESWLDREWSTSALGPELAGWDWLALHLSDGRDLMVYRLRRKDGGVAAESRATLIDADGRTQLYGPDAFGMKAAGWWTSPHTGARYPVSVSLEIPQANLRLQTEPLLEDQELRLSFRYWEGASTVTGQAGGAAITGSGYLELTGYAP